MNDMSNELYKALLDVVEEQNIKIKYFKQYTVRKEAELDEADRLNKWSLEMNVRGYKAMLNLLKTQQGWGTTSKAGNNLLEAYTCYVQCITTFEGLLEKYK